ncbi:GNAT family N-acetyltransferase [Rhodococcus chondri]|uniref:GNAT family N-acetyltransferase n=1 Tax=Rhodococcus chondri TaxID=3065941 RepID=A0ABU7JS15_9NOCA|nr:GNAT family N-acetyltransferase [Rhodococcus sp. CC-R104]MEE2032821.1 GNAT family N-acetyltransferase [Rhodococcus sp. CC-R104]
MEPFTLTDGSVVLSRPEPGDVDAITQACRDPAIAEWTTVPSPYSRADAAHFVGDLVPFKWANGFPDWAIRTSYTGRLYGMVGFAPRGESAPEIGYWVAPETRGQGLATAAVKLACDFAFRSDGMGLWRLEWRAFVGNYPSAAVARRTGFRFEGVARHGLVQRGIPRDVWVAALLRDDPRAPTGGWPL